ncbi:DUF2306 domain-containing protein [Halorubellus salinus]|uniref:DUF2306 domain-containing protein n=1 Tax=Halorubellus salinus TaxID=755309 RepID=UPI001D06F43F|nr:DUF2306 domain-containing protein [Halorubellus salinus]
MTILEDATLGVHILAGVVALVTGAGAIVTKKGNQRHRRLGRTYVYAMAVVSVTALGLLAIDQTIFRVFLGFVAVFSFYFAFSGYRVLSRKRTIDTPGTVDWVVTGLFGASGVALVAMGAWFLSEGIDFGIVVLVLGTIALTTTAGDVRQFRATDLEPRAWFFEHINRMGGAYIATITAVVTTNVSEVPGVPLPVIWLLPAAVGGIAIWYVSRQYKAKFDRGTSPQTAD